LKSFKSIPTSYPNHDGTSILRNKNQAVCWQRSNPNRGGKIVRKSYSHNSVPVSAPLHTYSLNHRSRDWLVDAVPTIIQRLVPIGLAVGRSTLLKIRRSSSPFCTMDILEARPEEWDGKSLSMAATQSGDGVVLVRPICSPIQHTRTVSHSDSPPCNSKDSQPEEALSCSTSFDVGHSPLSTHLLPHLCRKPAEPSSLLSPGEDLNPQYYGMVVQSGVHSDERCLDPTHCTDGCYLLKVCRSGGASTDGICACMHYSLLKVCKGQSLNEQLLESWLI